MVFGRVDDDSRIPAGLSGECDGTGAVVHDESNVVLVDGANSLLIVGIVLFSKLEPPGPGTGVPEFSVIDLFDRFQGSSYGDAVVFPRRRECLQGFG